MKRLLAISACSGRKNAPPNVPMPTPQEIESIGIRIVNDPRFSKFKKKAIDMYAGLEHLLISKNMKKIWQRYDYDFADLKIISAAFGMLNWDCEIVPYNLKFDEKCASQNRIRGRKLRIPQDFDNIIKEYELVIVMLGIPYLYSLNLPRVLPHAPSIIFLSNEKYTNLIPCQKNVFHFPAGSSLAKKVGTSARLIKGIVFEKITNKILDDENYIDSIISKPQIIENLID